MRRDAVPWRIAAAVMGAVLLCLVVVGVLRADGFPAVDATSPYSTRWFADSLSGRLVLIDGLSGKALARLEPGDETRVDDVAQGGGQASLIDRSARTMRAIDGIELKLGPGQPLSMLGDPGAMIGMSTNGLVVVDPGDDEARIMPAGGSPISIDVPADAAPARTQIAPDGAIWTLSDDRLHRTTANETTTVATGLESATFTLVGEQPLIVDRTRRQARFADTGWVALPSELQMDDLVVQQASPMDSCGWVGVDSRLLCIGDGKVEQDVTIDGLDIDGGDLLGIAGQAAAVVDRTTGNIVQLDWRLGTIVDEVQTGANTTNLRAATGPDLVWIDAPVGQTVWVVNPWGMTTVQKDDATTPLLGEEGGVVIQGEGETGDEVVPGIGEAETNEQEPDRDGVDDPPVAVDDVVTARSGNAVPINVTANDFDPDGEAIALIAATSPGSGSATVASATTVSYQPNVGFAGRDEFEYTIVDGNGTEATATVTIELVPPDGPNEAPVGAADKAQTGPQRPVVIDVLLNDVDPERDALRISGFESDVAAGAVEEVTTASGLPGLRFSPTEGFSGRARFTYTPMDVLGAVGEPVEVTVEVAAPGAENRPPITKPDAVRVRRNQPTEVAVLANDVDPDGDPLTVELVEPLPDSIDAVVDGNSLVVTARPGAAVLSPMRYLATDSAGLEAVGAVLVAVVDDAEPNRPPIANADTATSVAGKVTAIDVLQNDTDPDNDPLAIVSTSPPAEGGAVSIDGARLLYTAPAMRGVDEPFLDHFTYLITDTQGNDAEGVVSVKVLPEELPKPPVALDDSVNTEQDLPVTVDVLSNDTDPSGQPLSIAGEPGCPSGGTATVTTDDRVLFTPPTGESGVFNCSYEVVNPAGLRASAEITVSVVKPALANRPPLVIGEERAIRTGETVTVDVLANDSDPDGDSEALRLVKSTEPASGTVARDDRAGTITYTAPDVATVVSISYDVEDAEGAIASGRLVVRVLEAANKPPIANLDKRTVQAPVTDVFVDALANDTDPDGDPLDLRITGASVKSGKGSVKVADNGVRIAPTADFAGEIVVEYQITDADEQTATGEIVVVVIAPPQNRPPVVAPDRATVAAGERVEVRIALNDSDPDGDNLTFSISSGPDPSFGSARLSGGVLTFDARLDASGTAIINYVASDGEATASSTVTIDVVACAAAEPIANSEFIETGYQAPVEIDLNKYAQNGTIVDISGVISSPVATYTPPAGQNGNVTVNFAVVNACGGRAVGTLTIDVNQDPVASPVTLDVPRSGSRTVSVNSLAADDEPLKIAALSNAPTWATIESDGKDLALKPGQVSGRFDFNAVVEDPGGLRTQVGVTVNVANRKPQANDDVFTPAKVVAEITPIANDSDPDGDPISYHLVDSTATFGDSSAPVERVNDTTLRVDLTNIEGEGRFSYSVVDSSGVVSNTASVRLVPKWTAPVAENAAATVKAGENVTVDLVASDADGQALVISHGALPTGVTMAIDGRRLTITAADDAVDGEFAIPLVVTDTGGRKAEPTLTLTVEKKTKPTDPPDSTTSTSSPSSTPTPGGSTSKNAASQN